MNYAEWLVGLAAWLFLAGIVMMAAAALPPLARRRPRLLGTGFLVTLASFALVLVAWILPRLSG